ncbi:MAG: hypothetical protein HDR54_07655 [Treponema sp.]|nr:hypothetical protein [Treponema sp.]
MLKIKEGLKTATEIELLFLMASFFQNSLINCDFSLRYKIAFSAIQKLKLFSLLKIKEDLKQATGIVRRVASPPCYRVFACSQGRRTKTLVAVFNATFENVKNICEGAVKKAKSL